MEEESGLKDITLIDISDYQSINYAERNRELVEHLSNLYEQMIDQAMAAFGNAKKNHDEVEKLYIQNMDFSKVDELTEKIIQDVLA
jgi:hypothetical protein